jgi:hypothetical protein
MPSLQNPPLRKDGGFSFPNEAGASEQSQHFQHNNNDNDRADNIDN